MISRPPPAAHLCPSTHMYYASFVPAPESYAHPAPRPTGLAVSWTCPPPHHIASIRIASPPHHPPLSTTPCSVLPTSSTLNTCLPPVRPIHIWHTCVPHLPILSPTLAHPPMRWPTNTSGP